MRTFDEFSKQVKDSCESHASRKGYSQGEADGVNPLADFKWSIGLEPQHSIGEIVMKCVEYLACPRDVLLIKIAAWAFILYRYGKNPDTAAN